MTPLIGGAIFHSPLNGVLPVSPPHIVETFACIKAKEHILSKRILER